MEGLEAETKWSSSDKSAVFNSSASGAAAAMQPPDDVVQHACNTCRCPQRGKLILSKQGPELSFRCFGGVPDEIGAAIGTDESAAGPESASELRLSILWDPSSSASQSQLNKRKRKVDILDRLPVDANVERLAFPAGFAYPPSWTRQSHGAAASAASGAAVAYSGRLAHVMGLVPAAPTIAAVVRSSTCPPTGEQLMHWASSLARTVQTMLDRGVVHRNLCLQSLLLDMSRGGADDLEAAAGTPVIAKMEDALGVDLPSMRAGESSSSSSSSRPHHAQDAIEASFNSVKYRDLVGSGDSAGPDHSMLAPEVLDAWRMAQSSGDDMCIPYGKQASWSLGIVLHMLVTCGMHPFGEAYPAALHDGTELTYGTIQQAVEDGPIHLAGGSALYCQVDEIVNVVTALLRGDPKERMTVHEAVQHLWRAYNLSGRLRNHAVRLPAPVMSIVAQQVERAYLGSIEASNGVLDLLRGIESSGDWHIVSAMELVWITDCTEQRLRRAGRLADPVPQAAAHVSRVFSRLLLELLEHRPALVYLMLGQLHGAGGELAMCALRSLPMSRMVLRSIRAAIRHISLREQLLSGSQQDVESALGLIAKSGAPRVRPKDAWRSGLILALVQQFEAKSRRVRIMAIDAATELLSTNCVCSETFAASGGLGSLVRLLRRLPTESVSDHDQQVWAAALKLMQCCLSLNLSKYSAGKELVRLGLIQLLSAASAEAHGDWFPRAAELLYGLALANREIASRVFRASMVAILVRGHKEGF